MCCSLPNRKKSGFRALYFFFIACCASLPLDFSMEYTSMVTNHYENIFDVLNFEAYVGWSNLLAFVANVICLWWSKYSLR